MQGGQAEEHEGSADGADLGLDGDAVARSALDCYRNALKAADTVEATAWIRAGHWFERLMPIADARRHVAADGEQVERRAWARTGLSDGALLTVGTTIHIGRLRDLSAGGACVSQPSSLPAAVGDLLQLTAPGQGLNRAARIVARSEGHLHLSFVQSLTPVERLRAGLEVTPAAE